MNSYVILRLYGVYRIKVAQIAAENIVQTVLPLYPMGGI